MLTRIQVKDIEVKETQAIESINAFTFEKTTRKEWEVIITSQSGRTYGFRKRILPGTPKKEDLVFLSAVPNRLPREYPWNNTICKILSKEEFYAEKDKRISDRMSKIAMLYSEIEELKEL
ncbi:MAG: hypothetical protein WC755_07450 [Candidatus Woesearchaeota archaeon]|jgi:hypothetical protein